MKFVANLISFVFNPILLLTYLSFMLIYVFQSFQIHSAREEFYLLVLIFVFSFVIPALFLPFLKGLKLIESFSLKNRKERTIPYVVTALFYAYTAYLLYSKDIYPLLVHLFLFAGGVIIVVAVINLFFKISAHALSFVSLVGFVFVLIIQNNRWDYIVTLLVVILVSGLVLSSRKYLGAHDYFELITGSVLGLFLGAFASFIIM